MAVLRAYLMARLDTSVNTAWQRFAAGETARNLGDVARNIAAEFVSAVAQFLRQHRARRTLWLAVTGVLHLRASTHDLLYQQC